MKNTKIEWAHHTFNPWIGCTKVSPACDNCYAEKSMPAKFQGIQWGAGQPRKRTSEANWRGPIKWNNEAKRLGIRYRVFCASLADVFDNTVPVQWRIALMKLICETPNLDWLLLTKRIGNASEMLETAFRAVHHQREGWADNTPPNVWIGATICNQEEADRDIPKLLGTPAAKRFLSIEPMLGPIDLMDICPDRGQSTENHFSALYDPDDDGADQVPYVDWVIVGGESGPNARPMHPDWVRSIRDQCKIASTPFFFKQWGEWEVASTANGHHDCDMVRNKAIWLDRDGRTAKPSSAGLSFNAYAMIKVGKAKAGRILDGTTHDEVLI